MTKGFWTNKGFTDVFCEVIDSYDVLTGTWVTVRWWNKSQTGNPYKINDRTQTFLIKKDHLKNWFEFPLENIRVKELE